jgi:hypothetical protein
MLTARAASLPLSNLENIGMTNIECILLSLTIFLFIYFFLKKRSISIFYPVSALFLFLLTGTIKEISTRISNEIIVYNTPGSAIIGIKTGKVLNLYSDTSMAGPEVRRHCSTLGLKIKTNILRNNMNCIRAGEKNILICNSLNKNILRNFVPDIVILTGLHPEIEKDLQAIQFPRTLIITSEAASGFRLPREKLKIRVDTIHVVKKDGAFIKSI